MGEKLTGYEPIAQKYMDTVDQKAFHVFYERPNLLKHLPQDLSKKVVLDLGCGSGWYAEEILNRGGSLIALDHCAKFLESTKIRVRHQGRFYLHDGNLPMEFLKNNEVDWVIAPLFIHYVEEWKMLFKEVFRVLRPGGKMLLSTHQPHLDSVFFSLENYFEISVIKTEWEKIGDVEFYHHSLHDFFDCVLSSGLKIDRIEEPLPLKNLKENDSALYQRLTTQACLMFAVLSKH